MKQIRYPVAVTAQYGVQNAQALLKKQPLQIGLDEREVATLHRGSHLILDYGKESCGGVRILTFAAQNITVRIRFGESVSECCAELGGTQNATNDHAHRDFTTTLMSYSDLSFANTGYRFVRLDVTEGETLCIKSIVGTNVMLSARAVWKYDGTDREIARIYRTAKRTVDLCAGGDYVWDGVKRDRLVWVGDMHPEMLALTALYGPLKQLERSLDFVRDQTPLPNWMNHYPMYSMWWLIIQADYLERAKNRDYAQRQLPYLHGLLGLLNQCVDETGELHYPAYFVDWPTSGQADELAGCRAINVIAAKKAVWFLTQFGEDTTVAEELLRKLLLQKITVQKAKQVLGLKYFAVGLEEADREKLLAGGAAGMSTFMSYYVLKAVASFDKDAAVRMMKEYYGAMLSLGATSFWEDFDMDWLSQPTNTLLRLPKAGERDIHGDFGKFCYSGFRHSLCHGWSAGVLAFIKEECP